MFQRKEVALTNVPLSMVPMRMEVLGYSVPTMEVK
jgi:hypothetical protein